jgi:hypothetical protein
LFLYGTVAINLFVAVQGKELWSSQPAITSDFIRTAYLLGNGKLGGKCQAHSQRSVARLTE